LESYSDHPNIDDRHRIVQTNYSDTLSTLAERDVSSRNETSHFAMKRLISGMLYFSGLRVAQPNPTWGEMP
jgi:hypothetical protein